MSPCKLYYFDVKALGEPVRLLLTYNKIPFEDKRFGMDGKEWSEKKSLFPVGQLPVLEIDGITLHQSRAICRYLAKKCGLNGADDKEAAFIDIATDVMYDFRMSIRSLRDIDDPELKEKRYLELKENAIPFYLNALDNIVSENGGYFACNKLTWADLFFVGASEYFSSLCRFNILDDYPNLRKVSETVRSLPQLKEYLSERPETVY